VLFLFPVDKNSIFFPYRWLSYNKLFYLSIPATWSFIARAAQWHRAEQQPAPSRCPRVCLCVAVCSMTVSRRAAHNRGDWEGEGLNPFQVYLTSWKREISSASERAFPGVFGGFFCCNSLKKGGVLIHRIHSLLANWCHLSVESRALTCPFKQSNPSIWSLLSWHPMYDMY